MELLHLASRDGMLLRAAIESRPLPSVDAWLRPDAVFTCIQLPVPADFDVVGVCDICSEWRHLFYEHYSHSPGNDEGYYEHLIAMCVDCGGVHQAPWSDSHEESDESLRCIE